MNIKFLPNVPQPLLAHCITNKELSKIIKLNPDGSQSSMLSAFALLLTVLVIQGEGNLHFVTIYSDAVKYNNMAVHRKQSSKATYVFIH